LAPDRRNEFSGTDQPHRYRAFAGPRNRKRVGEASSPGCRERPAISCWRSSIRCSDDGKSLFADVQGNRRNRFKSLSNRTSARPKAGQNGPNLAKFPVVLPVRREFVQRILTRILAATGAHQPARDRAAYLSDGAGGKRPPLDSYI
jgi:hypothetical protein